MFVCLLLLYIKKSCLHLILCYNRTIFRPLLLICKWQSLCLYRYLTIFHVVPLCTNVCIFRKRHILSSSLLILNIPTYLSLDSVYPLFHLWCIFLHDWSHFFLVAFKFFLSMCCFFINKIAPSISLLLLQGKSLFPIQLYRTTKTLLVSWPRFH